MHVTKIALSPCTQGSIISYCQSLPDNHQGKVLWKSVEQAVGDIRMHQIGALMAASVVSGAPFVPINQWSFLVLNLVAWSGLGYSLFKMYQKADNVHRSIRGQFKVGWCSCEAQRVESSIPQAVYGTGSHGVVVPSTRSEEEAL